MASGEGAPHAFSLPLCRPRRRPNHIEQANSEDLPREPFLISSREDRLNTIFIQKDSPAKDQDYLLDLFLGTSPLKPHRRQSSYRGTGQEHVSPSLVDGCFEIDYLLPPPVFIDSGHYVDRRLKNHLRQQADHGSPRPTFRRVRYMLRSLQIGTWGLAPIWHYSNVGANSATLLPFRSSLRRRTCEKR